MDPVMRVRDYLLDNIGHMTYPGNASFNPTAQRWFVPIHCRTERGTVVVGDMELDPKGHIVFASTGAPMLLVVQVTRWPSFCYDERHETHDKSSYPLR
jgi:hypothetical protein